MLYSVGRFMIEGMRMDSLYVGELRVAQFISILLIVGAMALIVYRRKVVKEKYNDKNVTNKHKKLTSQFKNTIHLGQNYLDDEQKHFLTICHLNSNVFNL